MVRAEGEAKKAMQSEESDEQKAEARRARRAQRIAGTVAVMGISNLRSGSALALAGADATAAAKVMRWDLVNPWARLYELSSTHPMTALRVRALNQDATEMNLAVQYPLPEDQRIQWGRFPLEVLLWATPWLSAAALATLFWYPEWLPASSNGVPLSLAKPLWFLVLGVSWFLRVSYRYRGTFEDASIGTLLEDVEVSEMRPRAVRLKGEIVGRGVPGAFWSPDLVLRDPTGSFSSSTTNRSHSHGSCSPWARPKATSAGKSRSKAGTDAE